VRARGMWPRSLLAPFTDNADLTVGDQRAYISYAKTELHKTFETIDVSFRLPSSPAPPPAELDDRGGQPGGSVA
jgi:membrane protein